VNPDVALDRVPPFEYFVRNEGVAMNPIFNEENKIP
jgi:hypothetical protein